jgi:hypothetical protein
LNLEVNSEKDQEHKSQNIENEIIKKKSPVFYNKLKKSLFSPSKFTSPLHRQKSISKISKENSTKINKDSESNIIDNKIEFTNFNSRFKSSQRKFESLLKLTQNTPVNISNNNILSNPNISPNNKIFSNPFSQRNFTRNNFFKECLSSDDLNKKPENLEKNRPTTGKESHLFAANYIPPNLNRNNLYVGKLFSRLPLKSDVYVSIHGISSRKTTIFPVKGSRLTESLESIVFNLMNASNQSFGGVGFWSPYCVRLE